MAVPIEVVAIFGKQIPSLDMESPEYQTVPTWWGSGGDRPLAASKIIRVALTRRFNREAFFLVLSVISIGSERLS